MNEISGYCGLFYIITSTEDFLGSRKLGPKLILTEKEQQKGCSKILKAKKPDTGNKNRGDLVVK